MSVRVRGEEFKVDKEGKLDLMDQNITRIAEIEGLEALSDLQVLSLYGNQITQIEGMESLINLQALDLGNNQILKIEGLDRLQILKIEGLDRLVHLQRLLFTGNKIAKIEGLRPLVKLKWLMLGKNQIMKIEGLESLATLEWFIVGDNQVTKIEGLDSLVNLQRLHLQGNRITQIEGLESQAILREIRILGNPIAWPQGLSERSPAQEIVAYCRKSKGGGVPKGSRSYADLVRDIDVKVERERHKQHVPSLASFIPQYNNLASVLNLQDATSETLFCEIKNKIAGIYTEIFNLMQNSHAKIHAALQRSNWKPLALAALYYVQGKNFDRAYKIVQDLSKLDQKKNPNECLPGEYLYSNLILVIQHLSLQDPEQAEKEIQALKNMEDFMLRDIILDTINLAKKWKKASSPGDS